MPTLPEWADPAIVHRNRLHSHVPLAGYSDLAGACAGQSTNVQSLEGKWAFHLDRSPAEAPAEAAAEA